MSMNKVLKESKDVVSFKKEQARELFQLLGKHNELSLENTDNTVLKQMYYLLSGQKKQLAGIGAGILLWVMLQGNVSGLTEEIKEAKELVDKSRELCADIRHSGIQELQKFAVDIEEACEILMWITEGKFEEAIGALKL